MMIQLLRKIFFNRVIPKNIELGRWSLIYDPKVVHSKVDQANEDHCGCCQNIPIYSVIDDTDDYLLPYITESVHK